MRLVVIDDVPAIRARLVALLRESGISVIAEGTNAEEALELVRTLAPDAVVLDLHMPGRGGLDVLPALKAVPSPPRVVVLTNHPQDSYRAACIRHGADFFFDKSTEFERVVDALLGATHAS